MRWPRWRLVRSLNLGETIWSHLVRNWYSRKRKKMWISEYEKCSNEFKCVSAKGENNDEIEIASWWWWEMRRHMTNDDSLIYIIPLRRFRIIFAVSSSSCSDGDIEIRHSSPFLRHFLPALKWELLSVKSRIFPLSLSLEIALALTQIYHNNACAHREEKSWKHTSFFWLIDKFLIFFLMLEGSVS